ncbi:MAG: DUF4363 family protein [Clostridia bacterium]|nr:DUF4363 family protein [Clostridia bacterium]
MRRLVISTAAVFCACVALCVWSVVKLNGILDEAHEMTVEVFAQMEKGNVTAAREGLVHLANLWDDEMTLLELLCAHDDLHEVKERIIQAEICISYTDMEDFYASVALIGEALEHIRDGEALRLTNLY